MSTEMTLKQALNFTDDDLAANRAGQLSGSQRETLRTRALVSIVIAGVATIIFGVMSIVIVVSRQENLQCFLIPMLVAAALTAFGVVAQSAGLRYEMREATVKTVEGRADVDVQTLRSQNGRVRRRETFLIIKTDEGKNHSYRIQNDARDAFEHHGRYRLYYSPKTLVPLSAEKLETS